MNHIISLLAVALCLVVLPLPAGALDYNDMFTVKPALPEDECKETINRIREVRNQLMLLQDRLRALEKRKALETAAGQAGLERRGSASTTNWHEIDQLHLNPGTFGIYTYLLFSGREEDLANRGSLEELILAIDSLPLPTDPGAIGSRFILPVEPRKSTVVLSRRPYDFKLSRSYLTRLGLSDLPAGPILVSLNEPLDPYGLELAPPFLAVAFGRLEPQRALSLAKVWHGYEKPPLADAGHPLADLFWQLLDGAGPTRVIRTGSKLLIDLAPTIAVPHGNDRH